MRSRGKLVWLMADGKVGAAALLVLLILAGCDRTLPSGSSSERSASRTEESSSNITAPSLEGESFSPAPDAGGSTLAGRAASHPYFPLGVGTVSDFKESRIEGEVRYLRVRVGEPEMFFGRLAYPWTYSAIPGTIPDSALVGLRQYFSVGEDGSLLFHGAQNNGFMSHYDPPVRQLLARVEPEQAWTDTAFFESFFPGGIPFFSATEVLHWQLSERTHLRLPIGPVQAVRATFSLEVLDAPVPLEKMAGAKGLAALGAVGLREPDILKGFWFSRHRGIVARDYPLGQGSINLNHTTLELIARTLGRRNPL